MADEYVAALDQGTTSTRCMIFNHEGEVVAIEQLEHEQIFPKPGWVEHDPKEIWQRTRQVIEGACGKAGGTIKALGITNQRETAVVWDKNTGEPVHNAIVWQDTRTDKICTELESEGGQDRFRNKTGLPIATYFSGPKVRWILENVDGAAREGRGRRPDLRQHGHLVPVEPDGRHRRRPALTDPSNASRTMLMDLATLDWDDELCSAIGVPKAMLPEIHSSSRGLRRGQVGAARGRPDRGHPRRPAGRHVRPGVLTTSARRRTPTARATSCC